VPLRHGYTLATVHELTLAAVRCELFYRSRNYAERIDIAWSAIVEDLYASEQPPSRRDLIHTGMTAIGNWFVSRPGHHRAPQILFQQRLPGREDQAGAAADQGEGSPSPAEHHLRQPRRARRLGQGLAVLLPRDLPRAILDWFGIVGVDRHYHAADGTSR
jgi:hypothetical protein